MATVGSSLVDYGEAQLARLRDVPKAPPPEPWHAVAVHAVGGLTDIGYAPDSDLLLVVSHDGHGVFDGLTGERRARDPEPLDNTWHDPVHLVATGIGPLADQRIRLAGLWCGGLTRITVDGWRLDVVSPSWADDAVFLVPPRGDLYRGDATKLLDWDQVRAAGFSETGRTLAIAQAHTLYLFARGPF
jgi:hypothetical protein